MEDKDMVDKIAEVLRRKADGCCCDNNRERRRIALTLLKEFYMEVRK